MLCDVLPQQKNSKINKNYTLDQMGFISESKGDLTWKISSQNISYQQNEK